MHRPISTLLTNFMHNQKQSEVFDRKGKDRVGEASRREYRTPDRNQIKENWVINRSINLSNLEAFLEMNNE